jgi:hypothetical protein
MLTAGVAAAALAVSLLATEARFSAFAGAAGAGLSALLVAFTMSWALRSKEQRMQRALLAVLVSFMLRLLFIAGGVAVVHVAGGVPLAFVIAFFAPYLVFQVIEVAYVNAHAKAGEVTA